MRPFVLFAISPYQGYVLSIKKKKKALSSEVSLWCSGLRSLVVPQLWRFDQLQCRFNPWPGPSTCPDCGQKKEKKKNLRSIINVPEAFPLGVVSLVTFASPSGRCWFWNVEPLLVKSWMKKYHLFSTYMVIAFLGNSKNINTVRKMFCLHDLSRVKFSTLIIRNSFSTYTDAWWDLWTPWRMQDSPGQGQICSSIPALPIKCQLSTPNTVAPLPPASKRLSRRLCHSFWEPLL